jgi:hypothetical protein
LLLFRLSNEKEPTMRSNLQKFTLVLGVAFILIGILGFVPGFTHSPHVHDPSLEVDANYGRVLNLFAVNLVHNLVHIAFGVAGILFSKTDGMAVKYCRFVAIAYGGLALLGLLPPTYTVFGLVPIFGHDVWLHGAIAASAAFFGWSRSRRSIGGFHPGPA